MESGRQNYLLDNRASQAAQRFAALSALSDGVTLRHLCQVGLKAGWHCWEVGAGVPSLIADIVGSAGSVLATDIDTTWLPDGAQCVAQAAGAVEAGEAANAGPPGVLRVVRHDIERDAIAPARFDLVHARLVLVHLRERDAVLQKLVQALKPGGWLVIKDADPNLQPLACLEERGAYQRAQRLANQIRRGFRQLMAGRGVDRGYGRTLPRVLREAGLRAVGADVFFPLCRDETRALEIATIQMLREQLTAGERRGNCRMPGKSRPTAAGDRHRAAGFHMRTKTRPTLPDAARRRVPHRRKSCARILLSHRRAGVAELRAGPVGALAVSIRPSVPK